MRSFKDWLREASVPQSVDLTNKGKDKELAYWGACPATGCKISTPQQNKTTYRPNE